MTQKEKLELLTKMCKERGILLSAKEEIFERVGVLSSVIESGNNQTKQVSPYRATAKNYTGLY